MEYWQDKVALITGASSGLGRVLAGALIQAGAKVVLAARSEEPLERCAAELRRSGRDVLAVPADVTRQEQVDSLFAETLRRFGRLDMLVNNVGRSMRRAVLDTTPEDFSDLMDLNLIAAVRCTRAGAPHLVASRGHLVNIGSLAAKSAARYMGAYPASKFALAAYTQQLRLELGPQGLHVMLVCPGPVARDEPRERSADETAGLPESAKKPGAGVKVRLIPPEKLAAQILDGCRRRRTELVVPSSARWLFAVTQLWPRLGDYLVRRMT
ncbi:MAG: SDR family NAD(P)-dependent oxidoreductase [Pirellulales bacterium]